MQEQKLGLVPVEVNDTWDQERGRSFVESRLATLALEASDELNIESELSLVA